MWWLWWLLLSDRDSSENNEPEKPVKVYPKTDEGYYQQLIDTRADESSNDILAAAGALHMGMAITKLVSLATKRINFVISDLNEEYITDSFILDLKNAFDKGVEIKIILLFPIDKNCKLFNFLNDNQIVIKQAPAEFRRRLIKADKQFFIIVDDNKYFLQVNTSCNNGYFSFNDVKNTERLQKIFDAEYNKNAAMV